MLDSNYLPPSADSKKAEKYVSQFIHLIEVDKLTVIRTDLSKFDPSILQDHYRLDFMEYSVEISHSKQPNSGADSFVMLFTNIKNIAESGTCEKVILAYLHLDQNQFIRLKSATEGQLHRIKKAEQEKKFQAAILPIDQALEKLDNPTISSFSQNIDPVLSTEQARLENDLERTGMYLSDFSDNQPIQSHDFPEKFENTPLN